MTFAKPSDLRSPSRGAWRYGYNKPGEKWFDLVQAELDKEGLAAREEVFDPALNKKLENPVTVGEGYFLRLLLRSRHKRRRSRSRSLHC